LSLCGAIFPYLVIDLRMQEPEPQSSQDSNEEIELLREKLRRLEAEHTEVQQKLFDQYEWTREKTKAFGEELRSLRSISLEYKLLDFARKIYQRTTGLPDRSLEEEVEKLKIYLVAVPTSSGPDVVEWVRSLLRQTHANFELAIVQGASDRPLPQDIIDMANVRIVRTEDHYSTAVRANIGLGYASGDVYGFVLSGYWPYERTLENIGRCFVGSQNCQVLAPLDYAIWQNLIVPTEDPGQHDFTKVWRNSTSRHGSLFFRRKAYEKLGRIIFEAGESWVFATLFQLARYFIVKRPEALIFVNAALEGPQIRAQRESSNEYVRWRFYYRLVFEDSDKAFWPLPLFAPKRRLRYQETLRSAFLSGSNLAMLEVPRGLRYQQKIEQRFFQVRSWVLCLWQKLFPAKNRLHFRVDPIDNTYGSSRSVDLSGVECCPVTERLPDRLLFSLAPIGQSQAADVFYVSTTSISIIAQRGDSFPAPGEDGPCTEGQVEEKVVPGVQESSCASKVSGTKDTSGSQERSWRFIRPIALEPAGTVAAEQSEQQSVTESESNAVRTAYNAAVVAVLHGEKFVDALWIGDNRFGPTANSAISYSELRPWDEYPALATVNVQTLRESNLLAGRDTETGFDLIHLAGVLQLCRRPRHLLRFLAFALKYNAPILVSTPNLDSSELRQFGPAWCHWDPARTRFIYGVKSLRALMRHCGFEEKKLFTFSHPAWQSATRKNVANAIPSDASQKPATWKGTLKAEGKSATKPTDLAGDFLVGLFARKL
jgi:hypothetical protein